MHQLNCHGRSLHGQPIDKSFISTNTPPSNFIPNIDLPMSKGNNYPLSLLSSHKGQKISVLWTFSSRLNPWPITRMMSMDLATSFKSSMMVSSLRYRAWIRSLQPSLIWWIRGCNTRAKRRGPNGSPCYTLVADIICTSPI